MKAKVFQESFTNLLREIIAEEKEQTEKKKVPGNLKEYSPWMSAFKPEFSREDLEIPG